MRKGLFIVGLLLLFLPPLIGLLSYVKVTETDTVIDTSFAVKPGEKYGPYDSGSYHHTRILARSILRGIVSVEGEGLYFSIDGGPPIYIDQQYSFTIDPAIDQYTFTFDNTRSDAKSLVNFLLEEEWTQSRYPLGVFLGLSGLFLVSPVGLLLLIIGYFKHLIFDID